MPDHPVYINGINAFNISDADLTLSSSDPQEWIEYSVDSSYFVLDKINNITVTKATGEDEDSFMRIGIDTSVGDELNRSFYNMNYNETGEYLIRLSVGTD